MTVRNTRLTGHALRYEGRAIESASLQFGRREGRGGCECGATSPVLGSNGQRKRWHRDHKNDILSARGLESMNTRPKVIEGGGDQ